MESSGNARCPLAIVFNRRALAARALRRAGLEEALRERGLSFEIVEAASGPQSRALAADAARDGRIVVAAGGDGTTNDVLNGVIGAGRPDAVMGHIPLGTGNDFARALGRVSHGLEHAVDALMEMTVRSIDVAAANGEYYLNALGVGFDAEVVRRRQVQAFRLPGYVLDVARTMFTYSPRRYRVRWRDGEREGLALMAVAMNGICEGGGFNLAPDARLEDGLLDVYWIDPVNFGQFLRYVWAVRRGTHVNLPMVHRWRAGRLRVESERPIRYHVDGEYRELPEGVPLEVVVYPRRLRMIV